jgi:uncharacterized membrane protein YdjX (TVP38/TMEM64 family)
LVAAALVGAGLAVRATHLAGLRDLPPTPTGALIFVVAGAVLTASGLPRQVLAFAGGFVFGPWEGGALALLGQSLGAALDYAAAHTAAGDWAKRRLAKREAGTLARIRRMITAHPFTATLTLRLLPVGNNTVLNLVAGVAGVAAVPFLLASLIGYIPQTIIFALLGSGVHVGQTLRLAIAAALFIMSAVLGAVLWRRVMQSEQRAYR